MLFDLIFSTESRSALAEVTRVLRQPAITRRDSPARPCSRLLWSWCAFAIAVATLALLLASLVALGWSALETSADYVNRVDRPVGAPN